MIALGRTKRERRVVILLIGNFLALMIEVVALSPGVGQESLTAGMTGAIFLSVPALIFWPAIAAIVAAAVLSVAVIIDRVIGRARAKRA